MRYLIPVVFLLSACSNFKNSPHTKKIDIDYANGGYGGTLTGTMTEDQAKEWYRRFNTTDLDSTPNLISIDYANATTDSITTRTMTEDEAIKWNSFKTSDFTVESDDLTGTIGKYDSSTGYWTSRGTVLRVIDNDLPQVVFYDNGALVDIDTLKPAFDLSDLSIDPGVIQMSIDTSRYRLEIHGDTVQLIKLFYKEYLKQQELLNAAEDILSHITTEGKISDQKKFEAAVKYYMELKQKQ